LKNKKLAAKDRREESLLPPYYVAGLPGSFYTRLFPDHCVHLFHSSYCLMWRSKVPDELAGGAVLNEGHMYIWETTPPAVVALYRRQFQEDMSLFLRLRHRELVPGGHMVLAFLGRKKSKDVLRGEVSYTWGLLAQALQSLVKQVPSLNFSCACMQVQHHVSLLLDALHCVCVALHAYVWHAGPCEEG
jgi:anthranilate O-methyltransferase